MKYIDLYCSITAEDEMGGEGGTLDKTRHLCDSGLRVSGGQVVGGGGGEFSHAPSSDLTLLNIIV